MSTEFLKNILILAFVLLIFIAVLAGLIGLLKGLYKTTTKTILKTLLIVIAIFISPSIAISISNLDVSKIAGSESKLTIQNFLADMIYQYIPISPVNGVSIYETAIAIVDSLLSIIVFILLMILIQITISLVTALIYNTIVRFIIPVESEKERKSRLKNKRESDLKDGLLLNNEEQTFKEELADENKSSEPYSKTKTRRKLHLIKWPGAIIGAIQEFAFVMILLMPFSAIIKVATKNRETLDQVLNIVLKDDDKVSQVDSYIDTVTDSPLFKLLGIGDIDLHLTSTTSTISLNGNKIDLLSLINQTLDIATPVFESGSISYDKSQGKIILDLASLLSLNSIETIVSSLVENKMIVSMIPMLIDVVLNFTRSTQFSLDALDFSNVNWGNDLKSLYTIYEDLYIGCNLQPYILKDSVNLNDFSLDFNKITNEEKSKIIDAFSEIGKLDIVKKNLSILLSGLGRYFQSIGISVLSPNIDDYKDVDWGYDLETLGSVIIELFSIIDQPISTKIDSNELVNKATEALGDKDKLTDLKNTICGDKGLLTMSVIDCVSLADLTNSIFKVIPSISEYVKDIDMHQILDNLGRDGLNEEFKTMFDIAEQLFINNSSFKIDKINQLDLRDANTCSEISLTLNKCDKSIIFSKLFPKIMKSLLLNDDLHFQGSMLGLSPYNFNYESDSFIKELASIFNYVPDVYKMGENISKAQTVSEIINSFDIDTIRNILNLVANSDVFNSDHITGHLTESQKNLNITTILKTLFENQLLKDIGFVIPTNEVIQSINWGNGESDGEIKRLCKLIEDIKKNSQIFTKLDTLSIDTIPNGKEVSNLIKDGFNCSILQDSILYIIDKNVTKYLQDIGIPLTLNQLRNQMFKDDSDNIGDLIDILKTIDGLNDPTSFDFTKISKYQLNAFLTTISKLEIVKNSNSYSDPFGFALYSILKKQISNEFANYVQYSYFKLDSVDDWSSTTTKSKIIKCDDNLNELKDNDGNYIYYYTDDPKIDGNFYITKENEGEIYSITSFISKSIFSINQNLESIGDVLDYVSTSTIASSKVCKNLLQAIFTQYQNTLANGLVPDLFSQFIKSIDFTKFNDLTNDQYSQQLQFFANLDKLIEDHVEDHYTNYISGHGNDSIIKYIFNNLNSLKDVKRKDNDPNSQIQLTLLDDANYLISDLFSSPLLKQTKDGHILTPLQELLTIIIKNLEIENRVILNDDQIHIDESIKGILLNLLEDDYLNEGNVIKDVLTKIQGVDIEKLLDFSNQDSGYTDAQLKDLSETILTRLATSKVFKNVPISFIKDTVDSRMSVLIKEPSKDENSSEIKYPIDFNQHSSTSDTDMRFWQNEIDLFLKICFGDDEDFIDPYLNRRIQARYKEDVVDSNNTIIHHKGDLMFDTDNTTMIFEKCSYGILKYLKNGGIDLDKIKDNGGIETEFLYYIGQMKIFKDVRSNIVFNLLNSYSKSIGLNYLSIETVINKDENAPYGANPYSYKIENLLFNNSKLIDQNQDIQKRKMIKDFKMINQVFHQILINIFDPVTMSINFETFNCLAIDLYSENNTVKAYRSDFSSELIGNIETSLLNQTYIEQEISGVKQDMYIFHSNPFDKTSPLIYDLYCDEYKYINPIEGRFFDGALLYKSLVQNKTYLTFDDLKEPLMLFGTQSSHENDPIFNTSNASFKDLDKIEYCENNLQYSSRNSNSQLAMYNYQTNQNPNNYSFINLLASTKVQLKNTTSVIALESDSIKVDNQKFSDYILTHSFYDFLIGIQNLID